MEQPQESPNTPENLWYMRVSLSYCVLSPQHDCPAVSKPVADRKSADMRQGRRKGCEGLIVMIVPTDSHFADVSR